MFDVQNPSSIIGAPVLGSQDSKIGTVGQVYLDTATSAPKWITVRTGLFGTSESFAPLDAASWDGENVRLPLDKDYVKDAPRIDADSALSAEEEDALYTYYGSGQDSQSAQPSAFGSEGYDTSGPTTDDAMTRSEERLHVGTETVETGRARLRKHIVTEQQTVTVPVSHEEIRVVREPITGDNVDSALAGPELSEEEHEVVLSEERVVVGKETVPVERVSLGTTTVTEQEQVDAEVRKEVIDADVPDERDLGDRR
ncbi:DUF2382 domain-containing protein [Naasia lichenicola]|uniref:DUF2382 domain-containing protein n=1 Tax=Naasia lichenicola TaxID=2565933 RepID=A0A4S4FIY5_9MICO|nr:PRC and DUF2382 domain-containing protein [Naasia lichenicola]THG30048.1 DUF2382 domain-containing protein [Naasia lichenicola]